MCASPVPIAAAMKIRVRLMVTVHLHRCTPVAWAPPDVDCTGGCARELLSAIATPTSGRLWRVVQLVSAPAITESHSRITFAQKRSWVGRWSWAEQVGRLLLRVVQVVHQQRCNGHCLSDSVQHSSWKSNCAVHKSLGNGEGTPP